MESMRALNRRLSDLVYRTMVNDAVSPTRARQAAAQGAGPGGHPGATTNSSAADSDPNIDASEKSLPGPATRQPTTRSKLPLEQRGATSVRTTERAAVGRPVKRRY